MTAPPIPVFIAIDDPSAIKAALLIEKLPAWMGLKFGTTFIYENGLTVVAKLAEDRTLFVDAKLHDIPATMIKTARVIKARTNARFVTIHIEDEGGLRNTVQDFENEDCDLVGVFQLSHMSEYSTPWSSRLNLAAKCGLRWIVCPAWSLWSRLRNPLLLHDRETGRRPLLPMAVGIRMESHPADDHAMTVTPLEAVRRGAQALIIGRPVTEAPDPPKALETMLGGL